MKNNNPVDHRATRVLEIVNIRRAGRAELVLWPVVGALLYLYGSRLYAVPASASPLETLLYLLFTPFGLATATFVVVPAMFNYVFGFPPFTYTLARRRGLKGPDDVAWALGTTREEGREENEATIVRRQHAGRDSISKDVIEMELRRLAAGSELVKNSSLRRANIHLLAGAGVGLLGLVAFFAWESTLISPDAPADFSPWQLATWKTLLSVPRISMLVVIELMAGFFLRQYRIAMSEYRYFEEIDRMREAVVVSYMIRRSHPGKPALMELAANIESIARHQILTPGETSVILESEKLSKNEFAETIGRVVDSTKEVASATVARRKSRQESDG